MARARSSGSAGGGAAKGGGTAPKSGGGKGLAGKGGAGSSGAAAVLRFRVRQFTVMRGTAANAYGDETDVGNVLYTGVPVAYAETTDTVFDAATQRQQTVRSISAVFPSWADVQDTDTLQDESTGNYYMVESMQERPGIGFYPPDKILALRMRSGVSTGSD